MAYKAVEEARKAVEPKQESIREAVRLGLQMKRETLERNARVERETAAMALGLPSYWKTLPEISAHAYSDDRRIEVMVDARPWLLLATSENIQKMDAIEWGGDYEGDEVYHLADKVGCSEARRLASYLALDPTMPDGDTVSFEVHMDREEALYWLQEHRPDLFVPSEPEASVKASEAAPSPSAAQSGLTLTRKMVGAIAKAFEGQGGLSYLQRIDLVAKAIGFQNQATLMSVLGEAETRPTAKGSAPVSEDPATVVVAFGQGLSSRIEGEDDFEP